MKTMARRYHDISCGHRVVGHENKCAFIHGHNYRVHFSVVATKLDELGRVLDFSVINTRLCEWLEHNWDHKFLAWDQDPMFRVLCEYAADATAFVQETMDASKFLDSIVLVPFNPTAENMAQYLLTVVGPKQLEDLGCTLVEVVVEETRKCSVEVHLEESSPDIFLVGAAGGPSTR